MNLAVNLNLALNTSAAKVAGEKYRGLRKPSAPALRRMIGGWSFHVFVNLLDTTALYDRLFTQAGLPRSFENTDSQTLAQKYVGP